MPFTDKEKRNEYRRNKYISDKARAVEFLGSECVDCGTADELEFDHDDASTKTQKIAAMFGSASWDTILVELRKCVLRCHLCHVAKSSRVGDNGAVGHGEGLSGKRNCKCDLCKAKKAEYMRNYNRIR